MTQTDFRQRFVFDQLDARGCVARLQETISAIQATHHYPENLAKVLNQFALSATLLRDSIKIDGSLTIQLRTPGAISLILADCMADRRVRAIAEYDQEQLAPNDPILLNNFGKGAALAITITPLEGERYQSIVPIEHESLGLCLADYFQRSEQLSSQFLFHSTKDSAIGIALHALPPEKVKDPESTEEHFARLTMLLNTVSEQEALSLTAEELLTRIFHEESCRVFEAHPVEFGCVCSAQKSLEAIQALGEADVHKLIDEQKSEGNQSLVVDCHFCFQRYEFEFSHLHKLIQKT